MSELSKRLRAEAERGFFAHIPAEWCVEAADALEAKDARIVELETALREVDDLGASWPVEDAYYQACFVARQALKPQTPDQSDKS